MIYLYPFQDALNLFKLLLWYLQRRYQRLLSHEDDDDHMDLLFICQQQEKIAYRYMKVLSLLVQMRNLQVWRRKRRLVKPHMLIKLMHGYRATLYSSDVWINMQRNWTHFFWLTGETPDTLSILVQRLIAKFISFWSKGPESMIDFRNQVSLQSL